MKVKPVFLDFKPSWTKISALILQKDFKNLSAKSMKSKIKWNKTRNRWTKDGKKFIKIMNLIISWSTMKLKELEKQWMIYLKSIWRESGMLSRSYRKGLEGIHDYLSYNLKYISTMIQIKSAKEGNQKIYSLLFEKTQFLFL